ncbi:ferrochelatase [Methylovirgula sp. 4M-Z18]|uniref:ferrochelatase n=1 Tax=Methylovirgula sp. 4M-Z18 TaxID=2293567 RepID=UPI000E2F1C84|nr:ferrochelatase [Methylovirgula sp. 4M-Z18]RFB81333.1 ferrochelatase [Methylovirgula sp. 4M-Z18]
MNSSQTMPASGTPAQSRRPAGHPPLAAAKIGVLLMNLGTPEGTDYWSMRRYLKEFLSDRRVIETPRLQWWPLLNLIILQRRPQKKGKDYASIWNNELNEGPLKTITRNQATKLQSWIDAGGLAVPGGTVVVDWAMRYGLPDVASRVDALQQQGCERILFVPLYPQYAAATSATACDKVFEALAKMRWQPTARFSPPYHDQPAYIDALAASMRASLAQLDFQPEVILCSFHGIPREYFDKGDPYYCHCMKTARLLRDTLGLTEETFRVTFQSRFGPAEWLQPYTDATVKALAARGVKRLAIVAPGFSADCLETVEELGVENRHIFMSGGGEKFALLPCLNDGDDGMSVIQDIVRRELMGWI